ncbi:hypothetical protein ACN20G_33650 (plasmid) [Streptomyces sp. BI20]|uniref:hypothetical protein n=1 Tax=Streptomyces sp. BI20 TaxID=3403460 RepID=UPI003C76D7F4
MEIGDLMTRTALTRGTGYKVTRPHHDTVTLTIPTAEVGELRFTRPTEGGAGDWTFGTLHADDGTTSFNTHISPTWGIGLDLLVTGGAA